jgi:hypothetical protein
LLNVPSCSKGLSGGTDGASLSLCLGLLFLLSVVIVAVFDAFCWTFVALDLDTYGVDTENRSKL